MTRTRLLLAALCTVVPFAPVPAPLLAQVEPAAVARVEASGRATTQVAVTSRATPDARPTAHSVRIDYGQPHARGREIAGALVPYGQIWRTGANSATTLTTDVDLEIGGARVPKGTYTLYSLLERDGGWTLVVNRQTGQWGTEYDQAQDLARVDMTLRRLAEPVESFTMTLVPAAEPPAHGTLVLAWGRLHGSVPWRAVPEGGR